LFFSEDMIRSKIVIIIIANIFYVMHRECEDMTCLLSFSPHNHIIKDILLYSFYGTGSWRLMKFKFNLDISRSLQSIVWRPTQAHCLFFIHKVLFRNTVVPFVYIFSMATLWLQRQSRLFSQRPYGLQSWKYLLIVIYRKVLLTSFVNPYSCHFQEYFNYKREWKVWQQNPGLASGNLSSSLPLPNAAVGPWTSHST
jgi:hypothetical protein